MSLVEATEELLKFWKRYTEQPKSTRIRYYPHTLIKLGERHGLRRLQPAPAYDIQFGAPPTLSGVCGSNRYLWIIDRRGIPYIIERLLPYLDGVEPKHTNLTGGEDAYLGGELWFSDNSSLFLSEGSGRYPPIDANQLSDAVKVFESYRYRVISLGWNFVRNAAAREYNDY